MNQTKLNPEVKTKWLAALRSGEYKQTREVLTKENKFCCLGVLCDIYVKENPDSGLEWKSAPNKDVPELLFGSSYTNPSPKVCEWAGISHIGGGNPVVTIENTDRVDGLEATTLMGLNDDREWTFAQIADVIEAQL